MLQALNLAGAAMTNSLIGAIVKTGMIFVLASQPGFGIMGAALAMLIGIILVTLLHAATVGKVLPIHLPLKEYGLCVLVIIGTGAVSLWLKSQVDGLFSAPIELVTLIFFCYVHALCHSINLPRASETRRAAPHPVHWEAVLAHLFLITSSFKSI
ncbi:hypothetical protein BsIDN1_47950 [Bacillus safensis]|uniref:Uncharacterized protein n=1 Tax=Bacillus safensis TaxID=561879 RepID=A0A5S9MCF4_BACIA|nr:hypothetical protein BsIDN1_47950 [Bacillus safensis]